MTQEEKDKIYEIFDHIDTYYQTDSSMKELADEVMAIAEKSFTTRLAELEKEREELKDTIATIEAKHKNNIRQLQMLYKEAPHATNGLVSALADLVEFSGTWGREWFSNEQWRKIENAKNLLTKFKSTNNAEEGK